MFSQRSLKLLFSSAKSKINESISSFKSIFFFASNGNHNPDSLAYPIFMFYTCLSWYCLIFSMAEKQLRLTACRVRITIPAMLRRAFLFFRAVLVVTTADWGFIYTPSRSSSTDAGKSAHRPMGTAALAWSLSIGCLRQWSRECQCL